MSESISRDHENDQTGLETHDKRTETRACDLISRREAIESIDEYDFEFPNYMARFVTELKDAMKADLKHDIEKLPSAQPEIIRCRDCKHYKFADNRAFGFPVKCCSCTGFEDCDEDDFCSRAERREE